MYLPLPPFHPSFWIALALCALAAGTLSLLAFRDRPKPSPSPFSLRHAAILLLILIGLSVILSHGLKLAPLATPYVIAIAAALSIKTAYLGAWSPRYGPARAVVQAVLETGIALLLFQWFGQKWFHVAAMEDMTCALLPAVLGPCAVAVLCQFSNRATDQRVLGGAPLVGAGGSAREVSAAATRAVLIHAATLAALLTATACCAYTAAATPLPYESPITDRPLLIMALTPLPVMLGAGAALGAFVVSVWRSPAALIAALLLTLAPLACLFKPEVVAIFKVFGLSTTPLLAAWGVGLLAMVIAGTLDRFLKPPAAVRVIVTFLLFVIPVGLAGALCENAPGPIFDIAAKSIALLALTATLATFSRSPALPSSPSPNPQSAIPNPQSNLAFPLALAAAANVLFIAFALAGRSQLTAQAAAYSRDFNYPSANIPDPKLVPIMRENGHALYIGGRLFAYVDPGVTINPPEHNWRDMLLLPAGTPTDQFRVRGMYPAWRINDAGDLDGRIQFFNSQRIALFAPGMNMDQSPRLAEGFVVRSAKPAQIIAWASSGPANPRLWIGAALGLLLSILALRSRVENLAVALVLSVGTLLLCTFTLGLPGVGAFLLVRALILFGALAVGTIDRQRLGTVLLTVMSLAVVLAGVIVRMN